MPFFERNQCPEVERIITPTCHQVANQFRYRVGIEISSALYLLGGEILAQQGTQMPAEHTPMGGFNPILPRLRTLSGSQSRAACRRRSLVRFPRNLYCHGT